MKDTKYTAPIIITIAGIWIFILLYIIATFAYPGGSDADQQATAFSWKHNYWCELLASDARNGALNTARGIAIAAMGVLVISLIFFWYFAAARFQMRRTAGIWMRTTGIGSMLVLPFLLVADHDLIMNIAGLCGLTAMTILIVALYRSKYIMLFILGILCLLACLLNNYIYYTGSYLYMLPVIQKVTFVIFLAWFVLVSRSGRRQRIREN